MENKNSNTKIGVTILLVITAVAASIFIQAMWMSQPWGGVLGNTPYTSSAIGHPGAMMGQWGGRRGPGMGSWGGGCPMMSWWGGAGGVVNDTNIARYIEERTGYEVLSVEKYSNGYYVVVGLGGSPQYELLVFPNGVVHPEPQSVMWRGAPVRISEAQARSIAQNWLSRYFPGAEIEEVYTFPGYYTYHFKIGDDMQMLSVNAYSGAIWFHSWHGKYLGEV